MAQGQETQPKARAWAVLNNHVYRSLWLANVASGIGSTMHDTAAVWTMASLTTSPMLVTLMQTMSSLPIFLFTLPAGALADIIDRRRVMVVAQLGSLAVAAGLGAMAWAGKLNPHILLSATFLLGLGVAFTLPSWQALLPEIVDKKDLAAAITLGGIGFNVARAIGPVMGGLLVAALGPAAVFLLNSLSFVGLVVVLLRWRQEPKPRVSHSEQMLGAMIAALRYTRHSLAIRSVLAHHGAFSFFAIAPVALLPLIVKANQLKAVHFGLLMGAYGVGGVLNAFFVLPWLRARLSTERLLLIATATSAVAIGLLSFASQLIAMGALMFLAGATWLVALSTLSVAGQSVFPNWVRARSSAIQLITFQAALACGALLWGQVTAYSDTGLALRLAACGLVVSLLLFKLMPLTNILEMDLTPSGHWAGHQLAFEPAHSDGPVLITIDYEVRSADRDAFRTAISHLRTVRLRDGAFRWLLFQDMTRPEHFRESFLVGSWAEHLRQHERATVDDQQIEEQVERFHQGSSPPVVSHYLMQDVIEVGNRNPSRSQR